MEKMFMLRAFVVTVLILASGILIVSSIAGTLRSRFTQRKRLPRKVIIWCCGDDHLNMEKRILKEHDLQEGEYFTLSWAGGPNVVVHGAQGDKDFARRQIQLLVEKKGFDEAIVATHQHCAWLKDRGLTDPEQGKKDVPGIQTFLREIAPRVEVTFPYYFYADYETKTVCEKPEYIQVEQEALSLEPEL